MRGATILLADAEEKVRNHLSEAMAAEGAEVLACGDGTEAVRALKAHHVDAVITELRLPSLTGMELIDRALKLFPEPIIVVVTSHSQIDTAVEVMKKGVRDFIRKPVVADDITFRLKRLLAQERTARENQWLREQIRQRHDLSVLVGASPVATSLRETVQRTARTMSNVLIRGESGVGKELLARVIHTSGVTSDRPFVAVNCVGLSGPYAERELLGLGRDVPADSDAARSGVIEAANGGTLFLDEVGSLPPGCQAALLRALEQNAITRIGESRRRPIQLRVIATTSHDLAQNVRDRTFREDLYHRLDVVRIDVPALRDRVEDIPWFARYFLERYNEEMKTRCPGFTAEAIQALIQHPWRGNVRELENAVERALITNDGHELDVADVLPDAATGGDASTGTWNLRCANRAFERRHISSVLARCGYDKLAAARALGIGVSSLYRKMEQLGIRKDGSSEGSPNDD